MAKVIGLSGPQGAGKTTLLQGLKEKGIEVDDFKVSRVVQEQLGWDNLEQVLESPETMVKFQKEVQKVKLLRELANAHRTDVQAVLTERTFADIAAYTKLWCKELVEQGKWTLDESLTFFHSFTSDCQRYQQEYSANLLLPSMSHIHWQKDPHRAKQEHVEFITKELDNFFVRFFRDADPLVTPVLRLTKASVSERVAEAYACIHARFDV